MPRSLAAPAHRATATPRPSLLVLAAAIAAATLTPSWAQSLPDAGRVLQEQTPTAPAVPRPAPPLDFVSPLPTPAAPGGAQARVTRVEISGNSAIGTEQLLAVLGDVSARPLDLADLQGLAATLTRYYQAAGYPVARVFLPPQPLGEGLLRLQVVEGRYGRVAAEGDAALAPTVQSFLRDLRSGERIESAPLERAALLLNDLPGVDATARLRPGQAVGTGDLLVQAERGQRLSGAIGLDNQGSRYTGRYRAFADLALGSALVTGDQASARVLLSSDDLWLGNLGYSIPLGGTGLRAQASYSHAAYALGKEFSSLDAHGLARVGSIGLSYPVLRSRRHNLTLAVDLQHKQLDDDYRAARQSQSKFSNSVPLSARFDLRDGLGGGGITYGTLVWTSGTLKLDGSLAASDALSAGSAGHFDKFGIDVARMQALGLLGPRWSAYARLSGQWSRDNLDSSEDFGLGGPGGVRAYPVGEGYGDRGWLTQLELRYAADLVSPFVFYDAGRVRLAARPWTAGDNHRHVAGAGVGARLAWGGWQASASLAWRTAGGTSRADSRASSPVLWFSGSHAF